MERQNAGNTQSVDFTKKFGLLNLVVVFIIQGVACQRVKVDPEVMSYPGQQVNLRCQFPDVGNLQLTQVSWIWEPTEGDRTNIAVFHPNFGASYPTSALEGRVVFTAQPVTLANPSIQISNVKMTDEGKYICEYATYPTGNEQGTTSLVMLAKPRNSASTVTVAASTTPVVVARCESADGRPVAQISWVTDVNGNGTTSSSPGVTNTMTVTGEYTMVPSPADNGKDIACIVNHRTQSKAEIFPMKLAIEYPPQVQIVGYDDNWYLGRTNAELTCQADGNPIPTTVTWKAVSGVIPETVQIAENKLTVQKVDEATNTTFVCEVANRLGTGKHQLTVFVRATRLAEQGPRVGRIIGALIGLIILLAIIIVALVLMRRRQQNKTKKQGPPMYKPPPLRREGGSTGLLTSSHDPMSVPGALSHNFYYEAEPVTDLDACYDDDFKHTSFAWEYQGPSDDLPPYEESLGLKEFPSDQEETQEPGTLPSFLSYEDSFISSSMFV